MTGSGGRSSIPETPMIEPRSRGVLDTRLRGYDSCVCGHTILIIASELPHNLPKNTHLADKGQREQHGTKVGQPGPIDRGVGSLNQKKLADQNAVIASAFP